MFTGDVDKQKTTTTTKKATLTGYSEKLNWLIIEQISYCKWTGYNWTEAKPEAWKANYSGMKVKPVISGHIWMVDKWTGYNGTEAKLTGCCGTDEKLEALWTWLYFDIEGKWASCSGIEAKLKAKRTDYSMMEVNWTDLNVTERLKIKEKQNKLRVDKGHRLMSDRRVCPSIT